MKAHKVKITSGMHPKTTIILIDGKPLNACRSLDLQMSVDEVPTIKAEIYLSETDVEIDGLVQLITELNGVKYMLVAIE